MALYTQFPLTGIVNQIFLIRCMGIVTGYAVKHGPVPGINHALAIWVGCAVLARVAELADFNHIGF